MDYTQIGHSAPYHSGWQPEQQQADTEMEDYASHYQTTAPPAQWAQQSYHLEQSMQNEHAQYVNSQGFMHQESINQQQQYDEIPAYDDQAYQTQYAPAMVPPQKPRSRHLPLWDRLQDYWMHGWTIEIWSSLLSIASLAAIVIILVIHQGQPLPEWQFGITINALVAVFSVLLRAGVTVVAAEGISQLKWHWFSTGHPRRLIDMEEFDAASRGFWGSFLFLLRAEPSRLREGGGVLVRPWRVLQAVLSWRSSNSLNSFAKIAALITVLALAIDPFTQQIVQNVPCQQAHDISVPIVARTNSYSATGGHIGAGAPAVDAGIAVAMNRGLIDPPASSSSLIPVQCSSGNCEIPDFSTLAVCHTCKDITGSIRNITKPQSWPNISVPIGVDDGSEVRLTLKTGNLFRAEVSASWDSDADLTSVGMLAMPSTSAGLASAVAFSCRLSPCVRTIRAKVINSTLAEEELARQDIGFNQLYLTGGDGIIAAKLAITTVPPLNTVGNNVTSPGGTNCNGVSESSPEHSVRVAVANIDAAPGDSPSNNQDPGPVQWFPESCVWQMTYGSLSSIRANLYDNLNKQVMAMTGGAPEGTLISRKMYNNGNLNFHFIDKYWADLSDVMTASIRAHGGPEGDSAGEYAMGTVYEPRTCLSVKWAWLVYPAALVAMSSVWLVGLLVWYKVHDDAAGKKGLVDNAWKSSSLALLMTGISDHLVAHRVATGDWKGPGDVFGMSRGQFEALARDTEVTLVRDFEGRPKLQ